MGTKFIIKHALSSARSGFKILHPHKILITVTIPEIREQKAIRATKPIIYKTYFCDKSVCARTCYFQSRLFKFQDFPLLTTDYNQQN